MNRLLSRRMSSRHLLYLFRRAPHGTLYGWEMLQSVLVGAAFEQQVSLAFVEDGVYQLVRGSDTSATSSKNFMPVYQVLADYGVDQVYVDQAALTARGLNRQSLWRVTDEETGRDLLTLCDTEQLQTLLATADVVFS
ncbi:MAG: DsrE family protein [Pseudomonadota bacterium]